MNVSFHTPKTLTYYFNAYIDAQMAQEVVSVIKTGDLATQNTIPAQRVQQLLDSGKQPIGIGYTLYYANGLANYLYARMLQQTLFRNRAQSLQLINKYNQKLLETITTDQLFEEYHGNRRVFWTYWPQMAINSRKWFDQFCKLHDLDIKSPSREELIAAALEVQHQNSAWNQQIGKLLTSNQKSKNPKVVFLREAAAETSNPHQFLRRCANTQVAAARWDGLYRKLMRVSEHPTV